MAPLTALNRRTLLQSLLGGGLVAALSPSAASGAWQTVAAAGAGANTRILDAEQTRLVTLVADTILPRTDTPGAIDVGVVQWIETIVAGYFSEAQRARFLSGLAAIDDFARSIVGAPLAVLPVAARAAIITDLDSACGIKNPTPPQRGYIDLKELVLHGYFTSQTVQKDLLQVVVVPGRYDPSVPDASRGAK